MQIDIYIGIYLIIIFLSLLSAIYFISRKNFTLISLTGILILFSSIFWCIGSALEVYSTDISNKTFWDQMQYLGKAPAPFLWLLLSLLYTGKEKYITGRLLIFAGIIPFTFLIMALTNDNHGIMYTIPQAARHITEIEKAYHWGFSAYLVYALFSVIAGLWIFARAFSRSPYRRGIQIAALLLSATGVFGGSLFDITGVLPVDIAPVIFSAAAGYLLLNYQKLQLIDLKRVSQDIVIRNMEDPLLVIDEQFRILEMNKAAQIALAIAPDDLGKSILAFYPDWSKHLEGEDIPGQNIVTGTEKRVYDMLLSPVRDWSNRITSHIIVLRDITERNWAEEAYRALVDHSLQGMLLYQDGKIVFSNKAMTDITGYSEAEIKSFTVDDSKKFIHPEDLPAMLQEHRDRLAGKAAQEYYEFRFIRKDTKARWLEAFVKTIEFRGRDAIQAVAIDITERKEAEELIRESLSEKEILLKEIHHRVKNNFQIITSLLSLQANRIKNEKLRDVFMDSNNRIRIMALIHEKLYGSKDLSRINFREYLNVIAQELLQIYGDISRATITIDADDIELNIERAIPCGLILNELLTNAMKNAFPPEWEGKREISIALKFHENNILLAIADNGVGMPVDFEIEKTDSLGLRLVHILTKNQLKGSIEMKCSSGTRFSILFPVP